MRADKRATMIGVALAVFIAIVAYGLDGAGHHEAALTFVLTTGLWTLVLWVPATRFQWHAVRTVPENGPIRTHRIDEAARLPAPADVVWNLVYPVENAPLIDPTIRTGFRIPGTPKDAVGEQLVSIDAGGKVSIQEVIEISVPARLVTRVVWPRLPVEMRFTQDLQPVESGCILTHGLEVDGPGAVAPNEVEIAEWRDSNLDLFVNIRLTLDPYDE